MAEALAKDLLEAYPHYYESHPFDEIVEAIVDANEDGHKWKTIEDLHKCISTYYV